MPDRGGAAEDGDRRRETPVTSATTRRRSPAPGHRPAHPATPATPATAATPDTPAVIIAETPGHGMPGSALELDAVVHRVLGAARRHYHHADAAQQRLPELPQRVGVPGEPGGRRQAERRRPERQEVLVLDVDVVGRGAHRVVERRPAGEPADRRPGVSPE